MRAAGICSVLTWIQPPSSGFEQSCRKIATTSLGGEFTLLMESFPHLPPAEPSMSTAKTDGQRTYFPQGIHQKGKPGLTAVVDDAMLPINTPFGGLNESSTPCSRLVQVELFSR
jgi:hypothetical protein